MFKFNKIHKTHEKIHKTHKKKDKNKTCMTCENCIYIGEGDSICDALVFEDFIPSDEYYACNGSEYVEMR